MSDSTVKCPYCQKPAKQVQGDHVYPHRPDLHGKWFYVCDPCEARVGCHPGTRKPLGRLANAELRKAKSVAHRAFDPIWKTKKMDRRAAYQSLADKLGIPANECHIGEFDVAQCRKVVEVCQ